MRGGGEREKNGYISRRKWFRNVENRYRTRSRTHSWINSIEGYDKDGRQHDRKQDSGRIHGL